jgi:hypothetical protein
MALETLTGRTPSCASSARRPGRFEPVLDLIAAGAFDDVQRIETVSPGEYRPGHEHKDDFCFAAVLHELCRPAPDETRLESMLGRLETALDGQSPVRLEVLRSLALREQSLFDISFQALLAQRTVQIAADKERGVIEEPVVMAERQVFIEGLAMLRLAGYRGLATDESISIVRLWPAFPSAYRSPTHRWRAGSRSATPACPELPDRL